jgi:hypothetical protein
VIAKRLNLFLGLLGLLSQDLLHDLLFLNKESTHNSITTTGSAAGSAIGTGHGLLALLAVLESSGIHVLDLNWKEERKKLD